jgi:hypothetical protein
MPCLRLSQADGAVSTRRLRLLSGALCAGGGHVTKAPSYTGTAARTSKRPMRALEPARDLVAEPNDQRTLPAHLR